MAIPAVSISQFLRRLLMPEKYGPRPSEGNVPIPNSVAYVSNPRPLISPTTSPTLRPIPPQGIRIPTPLSQNPMPPAGSPNGTGLTSPASSTLVPILGYIIVGVALVYEVTQVLEEYYSSDNEVTGDGAGAPAYVHLPKVEGGSAPTNSADFNRWPTINVDGPTQDDDIIAMADDPKGSDKPSPAIVNDKSREDGVRKITKEVKTDAGDVVGREIAPGIVRLNGYGFSAYSLVVDSADSDGRHLLIVDPPPLNGARGKYLEHLIDQANPVTMTVVITHFHPDHTRALVDGASFLKRIAAPKFVVTHHIDEVAPPEFATRGDESDDIGRLSADVMEDVSRFFALHEADIVIAPPDHRFTIGKIGVRLLPLPGHSIDHKGMVITLPDGQKIIYTADIDTQAALPHHDSDVEEFLASLNVVRSELKAGQIMWVVNSHRKALMDPSKAGDYLDMVEDKVRDGMEYVDQFVHESGATGATVADILEGRLLFPLPPTHADGYEDLLRPPLSESIGMTYRSVNRAQAMSYLRYLERIGRVTHIGDKFYGR